MKNKPCAFCGSTEKDNPRTKGHVVQKSMYPEVGFETVRRITVPECARCSAIWQDAEDHFRSVMALAAADHNEHADAQWDGPISRAHRRAEDGRQRMGELLKWVVERDTPEGKEYVLHPADIEKVLLVVRKMVRGLCHYHGLTTQVADHQMLAMQYEHSPPPGAEAVEYNHVPGVFRYSYFHQHLEPGTIHVSWLLTFYERISFIGLVSAERIMTRSCKNLKATTGDVPRPGRPR